MKVTCPECLAVYKIPDERITRAVARATCKKCGARFIIRRPDAADQQPRPSLDTFGDEGVVQH